MRALIDKKTGLWKWSSFPKNKYRSKGECKAAGIALLAEKLKQIRDSLNGRVH